MDEEKFYKPFEKQITKENLNLDLIKKIVSLYMKKIDENDAVLISSMFFDDQNDETDNSFLATLLNVIAKGNSKKIRNVSVKLFETIFF